MIEFTWNARKARRNERLHGVSFSVARAALESRLGVEIEEQLREEEWRTVVVAPIRGTLLLHIILAFYPRGEDEDSDIGNDEETQQGWSGEHGVIRIISARKATPHEQGVYFAARPSEVG